MNTAIPDAIDLREELQRARDTNRILHRRVQEGERALRVAHGLRKAAEDLAKSYGRVMEHYRHEAVSSERELYHLKNMPGMGLVRWVAKALKR